MIRVDLMMRSAFVLACAALLVGVVTSGEASNSYQHEYAELLLEQGIVAEEAAQYTEAIALYLEALVIVRALEDAYTEGLLFHKLGRSYYALSDYGQAISYYEQSIAIRRRIGDREGEAASLNNLGLCHKQLSDHTRAIECYEQSIAIEHDLGNREGEAISLINLGLSYWSLSQYEQAINSFEQILAIRQELGDHRGEAAILGVLASCHRSLYDYFCAIDCYEQAILIWRGLGDYEAEAESLRNLGNCYETIPDYQKAIETFESERLLHKELGDRSAEASALNSLGNCHNKLSDYARAIHYYEQARHIFAEIGNQSGEAASLANLAGCHHSLSDNGRAIAGFEQALLIFREIGSRAGEAICLNNLGVCYHGLSDYSQAIDYHTQSLTIHHEMGNRTWEADALNGLGKCYRSLSDYSRAIDYHTQSLTIYREMHNLSGEASSLYSLGICYYPLADYSRAIDYLEQAVAMSRTSGERNKELNSLNALGGCYHRLSDNIRAADYFEQALAISREIGDRNGEAGCLANLGSCYASLANYGLAVDRYEQALSIFMEINDSHGQAASLGGLGISYLELSDYGQAIDYLEQALHLAAELGRMDLEQILHWDFGRAYRALEQPEAALSHYESAIEIVESIRDSVRDEELRQAYFDSLRSLYEEYLELLLELGQNEHTILVAERLRARTFLDSLYQLGLSPEQLQQDVAGINRTGDDVLPVMDYNALKLAVEESQSSLLPNEAVLEYMVGDNGIYVWILTGSEVLGPEFIPYNREQLMRDVVALRQAIEPQTEEVGGQTEIIFSDPSAQLGAFYELLIQPALPKLAEAVDTLIIIPSGPLWYVPFSALVMTDQPDIEFGSVGPGGTRQCRPQYLLDEYTLAFLPSLASLPMLMEERAPSTAMYLALANPTLSENQQEEVSSRYQFPVLEATCLAFAECISSVDLSVQEQVVYVQKEALESRAHNEASGHEVLIYACHGVFNPSVPLDSRLLLAPSLEADDETIDRRLSDGNYYAFEVILTDHTGVDLVILAACETLLPTLREVQGALGMTLGPESDEKLNAQQLELIVAGDEVVGLSRAFLSSGAGSVLGTLWQANPTAISELLVALCEAYPKEEEAGSWAVALREAQRAILEESISTFTLTYQTGLAGAHPWFWGAYQLVGRWR
jgi:tetratricopeptide (TPR) repeat protein/CHAT domain-containing protein